MKNYQVFKTVLEQDSIDNVVEVLKSGWIGLGPKTVEFENEFAKYLSVDHCIGLNSATSALLLALHVLDIKPGDEVITTPITFISTNHSILYHGATPVFADVNPLNGLMDIEDVKRKITSKTKAIIPVHLSGCPVDLQELYHISRVYNIPIIEDCAHACGSQWEFKRVGSTGLLHCFSFHAVKNLPIGDGGAITTNNPYYAERLKKLRWLGINKSTFDRTESKGDIPNKYLWDYDVDEVGYKCHMFDIVAAIGLGELKHLDAHNQHRLNIAQVYAKELANKPDDVTLPVYPTHYNWESAMHFFPIFVNHRDEVVARLKERGISPGVHYKRNDMYRMYTKTDLPGAEYFWTHELTLPMHLGISEDDAKQIAHILLEVIYEIH